ncbi:hypothetical protein J6590_065879 [Homalodisca vitripennis]|nr:hypothetical protein J6590_065879 [Homalodisca vitripennis]
MRTVATGVMGAANATNSLEVTLEPPPMARQAFVRTGLLNGHPSKYQLRLTFIMQDLSEELPNHSEMNPPSLLNGKQTADRGNTSPAATAAVMPRQLFPNNNNDRRYPVRIRNPVDRLNL